MKALQVQANRVYRRPKFGPSVLIVFALIASVASGCASGGDKEDDQGVETDVKPERARYGNLVTDDLEPELADLNGDDQPDQWMYHDEEGNLVRVERDMNFNGQVDLWEYYDSQGALIEEEMALDTSGRVVDVVIFYEGEHIKRKMMATGYDGEFPIENFYDNEGNLLRVERDSSGDGEVDVWEYYDDGQRSRIGWDTSGDGRPDTFDQL